MSDELVERVARAIYNARNPPTPLRIKFERLAELGWHDELAANRELACAALSALPSHELLREALEALEPFAKMAIALNAAISSNEDVLIEGLGDDPPVITVGDLRRARAALDQQGERG